MNKHTFKFNNQNKFTESQLKTLAAFEDFPYVEKNEEYDFNKNTPYSCINLRQMHFENGTVRITQPGIYNLKENIVFEPNANNDFMPTYDQVKSNQYPIGLNGAYHLGFFAAITIECEDVILNLNKYTIKQSKLHYLQQRFYANIELASSPFIPKQGPGGFSTRNTYKAASNVLIKNGTLGLSSHHGIHGNTMKGIILQDLIFEDFEIAGIALNGAMDSFLHNITLKNTHLNVPVSSKYSQARFARQFLKNVPKNIMFNRKTGDDIMLELNKQLKETEKQFMNGKAPNTFFKHPNYGQGADGNVYGLVLNINGVAINDFVLSRPMNAIGNKNIYLENIYIENITSHPEEIIAISSSNEMEGAYGGKRQVGSAGDVLDANAITNDEGLYNGNILSDVQLIIGKAKNNNNKLSLGTVNIEKEVIAWAEQKKENLNDMIEKNNYYFVKGGDSMGHIMKGSLGLFVSCGENIEIKGLHVYCLKNKATKIGLDDKNTPNSAKGGNARGVCITGSEKIYLHSPAFYNIKTDNKISNSINLEVL
jgi:hypothetical protein